MKVPQGVRLENILPAFIDFLNARRVVTVQEFKPQAQIKRSSVWPLCHGDMAMGFTMAEIANDNLSMVVTFQHAKGVLTAQQDIIIAALYLQPILLLKPPDLSKCSNVDKNVPILWGVSDTDSWGEKTALL